MTSHKIQVHLILLTQMNKRLFSRWKGFARLGIFIAFTKSLIFGATARIETIAQIVVSFPLSPSLDSLCISMLMVVPPSHHARRPRYSSRHELSRSDQALLRQHPQQPALLGFCQSAAAVQNLPFTRSFALARGGAALFAVSNYE